MDLGIHPDTSMVDSSPSWGRGLASLANSMWIDDLPTLHNSKPSSNDTMHEAAHL